MIVDCAVYGDGRRLERAGGLRGLRTDTQRAGGFAWVGLFEPTAAEFEEVAEEFALHELAVEDAVRAHQRPKLERYGETLFLVVKTANYLGSDEVVEIGELMAFVGPGFLITVRHGEGGGLGEVRAELERDPDTLRRGPRAALHALVDRVVDASGRWSRVSGRTSRRSRPRCSRRTPAIPSSGSTSSGARCSSSSVRSHRSRLRRRSWHPPPTTSSRRISATSPTPRPGSPSRSTASPRCSRACSRRT